MYPFIVSKNINYSISEKDIKIIEERFAVTFPQALKDYYIQFNCADICLCRYVKGTEIYEVDAIYPIKYKYPKYMPLLETLLERDRIGEYVPYDMVPFAADQSEGCYYCDKNGQVFLILSYDIDNPVLVCDNFSEFITGLVKI